MKALRRLRIVNAILLATCSAMGYALWERSTAPVNESALARHVKPMKFESKPIKECVDELAAAAGTVVEADWDYIQLMGVRPSDPLTACIGNVPLANALRRAIGIAGRMADPDGIELGEKDGVVLISQRAPHPLVVRSYDLSWMEVGSQVPAPSARSAIFGDSAARSSDPFVDALATLLIIRIQDARPAYGGGQWMYCIGRKLLVHDTIENQSAIAEYLAELRHALGNPVDLSQAATPSRASDELRHRRLPSLVFREEPLAHALKRLEAAARVHVHVQWDRLALFSDVTPASLVALDASGMQLDRALNEMLARLNGDANPMRRIDWYAQGDFIMIGIQVELLRAMETRAYSVRDLVPTPAAILALDPNSEQPNEPPETLFLREVMNHLNIPRSSVTLTYWNGALLVTCRPEYHDEIVRVLQEMRVALKK